MGRAQLGDSFLHKVAARITQLYSTGGSGTAPLSWLVPGRNGWKSRLSQGRQGGLFLSMWSQAPPQGNQASSVVAQSHSMSVPRNPRKSYEASQDLASKALGHHPTMFYCQAGHEASPDASRMKRDLLSQSRPALTSHRSCPAT